MMNMNLTQKFSSLFLAGAVAFGGSVQAQTIIWGAGSGDATSEAIGEFADDFGTANGWTATSVNDGNGAPGAAFWVRSTTGTSQGAYFGTQTAINSPSMANGVALFDSDFMDNAGTAGNFGMGTSPSPHKGFLTSPTFDLTGQTDQVLAARMYLYYRNFDIAELSVGFSSDNGATWDYFSIDQGVAVNTAFPADYVEVTLTNVTAGVIDLTQCQMRLVFDGDYYYAMVDDISLVQGNPYDLAFSGSFDAFDNKTIAYPAPFELMPTYATQGFGTYMFGALVTNKGGETITTAMNPTLNYDVKFESPATPGVWTSVESGSVAIPHDILAADTASVSGDITTEMEAVYAANGEGYYQIVYWLTHSGTDGDSSNDTLSLDWHITDKWYSSCPYENGVDATEGPAANDFAFPGVGNAANVVQEFEWGGLFYFPDTTGIALSSVDYRLYASGTLNPALVPEVMVTVNVYEWVDANTDGQVDFETELQLRTLAVDTVPTAGTPGTYIHRTVDIVDPNNLNPVTFQYDYPYGLWQGGSADGLYCVTTSQSNTNGLIQLDAQRNGFFIATFGAPYEWNQDFSIEAYTPLRVVEGAPGAAGTTSWYSGFSGAHQAPSILLGTSQWPLEIGVKYTETSSDALSVFPNPATNMTNVTLNLDKVSASVRYMLTDAQGRVLNMQTRNNVQNDVYSMDVTNLAAGVYFIHVKTDAGTMSKRFVKQ